MERRSDADERTVAAARADGAQCPPMAGSLPRAGSVGPAAAGPE
ncbi:hypothetical protein QC334_18540 [Streptomyces sp. DH18]|nr:MULTISPECIES: hypothetical protein [unclassified Streptomyces]MDG9684700.1 hypothetical protein [Streptomyces sp. DH18]